MEKPPQQIDFSTDICHSLTKGFSREWLVINEIDEYANGTIAGRLSELKIIYQKTIPHLSANIRGSLRYIKIRSKFVGLLSYSNTDSAHKDPPQSVRDLTGSHHTAPAAVALQLGP